MTRFCKNQKCKNNINHKHKNAKFCSTKCKDRHHNTTNPIRLERAKKYAKKEIIRVESKTSSLERLLDVKIAQMDSFLCVDQD